MPEQLSLAPVHRDDGQESREAASRVDAAGQLRAVLNALYDATRPLTDDDLGRAIGKKREHAGTRRGVGVKRGWVKREGSGTTDAGNPCAAWVLTEEGVRYVRSLRQEAA